MTHDELLAKVDKLTDQDFGVVLGPALRAVVELHQPREEANYCAKCRNADGHLIAYPCPTIEVIEKEL